MKVSYSQLEQLTGFTYRTLKKRMDGLQPVGRGRNAANLWESIEALPLIYQVDQGNGDGDPDGDGDGESRVDYDEQWKQQRARLAKEQADAQALKNAVRRRELIPADKVRETWERIVGAANKQFLGLPARLAQMLETATTTDEVREIIDAEIKAVLYSLAKGEKD